MRIAIDCRYIGKSGIGRVCEGILDALDFTEHEFFLIGKRTQLEKYPATIVEDDSEPYSFSGLRSFEKSLNKRCDALFIPNFLVPFGVKIPVYAVMHDLIFLDMKETTRGMKDRLIKKILLKRCMKKSKTVFCDSMFTRDRCRHHFGRRAKKCVVNYVGVSEAVYRYAEAHAPAEKENTVVFVGNVKAHKGITTLLSAFEKCEEGMRLKIIGKKENFLTGLKLEETSYKNVEFTGELTDDELFDEIARAKYLVQPSKYEGFGLPPLEALVLGTQPIVSDIPVFREVYAGLPVKYFRTEEELIKFLLEEPTLCNSVQEIKNRYNYRVCTKTILEHMRRGK